LKPTIHWFPFIADCMDRQYILSSSIVGMSN